MKCKCHKLAVTLGFALILSGAGCGKSKPQTDEQKAIEKHKEDLQQQKALKEMQGSWEKSPAAASTSEAIKAMSEMKHSGELPGLENAQSKLTFKINFFSTNYPISRIFDVKLTNSHLMNHYNLVKDTAEGSWHLTRAWQTDTNHTVTLEYALPKSSKPNSSGPNGP